MPAPIAFKFGGRNWLAERVADDTKTFWRIRYAQRRPFPTKTEYAAAVAFFYRTHAPYQKPTGALKRAARNWLAPQSIS